MIIGAFLLIAMGLVVIFDASRYIIPNWLVAILLAAYPVAVIMSPVQVDWLMAVVGMLIYFAVGFGMFTLRWMGGGDVKLFTVLALWVGWGPKLFTFFVGFSLLGGALTIFLLVTRGLLPKSKQDKLPRLLQRGAPVPYGLAIAGAFVWLLLNGSIPLAVLPA